MLPDGGPLLRLWPVLQAAGRWSRRAVLSGAGPVTAALWIAGSCRRSTPTRTQPEASDPVLSAQRAGRVLTGAAWIALDAATARILPSDDGPGAREAGVVAFIDAQLETKVLNPIARAILLTAELLDRAAQAEGGTAFAQLATDAQDRLLAALAHGKLPAKSFPQREAFRALHALTLEGFLSDPVYGGNAGMVGWRSVDFPEPGLRPPAERRIRLPVDRSNDGGR